MDQVEELIKNIFYWNSRGYRIEDDKITAVPYEGSSRFILLKKQEHLDVHSLYIDGTTTFSSSEDIFEYEIIVDTENKFISLDGFDNSLGFSLPGGKCEKCGFYNISFDDKYEVLKINFVHFPNILPANPENISLPLMMVKSDVLTYHIDLIFGVDEKDYIVIDEMATHNTQKATLAHIYQLYNWLQNNYDLVYRILHSDKLRISLNNLPGAIVSYTRDNSMVNIIMTNRDADQFQVNYNKFFTLIMNGTWRVELI